MKSVADLDRAIQREQLWAYALAATFVMITWHLFAHWLGVENSWNAPLRNLRFGHTCVLVILLGYLVFARSRVTATQAKLAGLAVLLPLPVFLWLNQTAKLMANIPDPFRGHRISIVLIAILFPASPPTVLGAVVLMTLLGVLHIGLWTSAGHALLDPADPWLLLLYALSAAIIVVLRAALERAQCQYVRARAALAAIDRLAAVIQALRDGANTPLQTIETTAFLQQTLDPKLRATASRLERSADQLHRVLEALHFEDLTRWEEGDVSFRAEQRLRVLQEELERDAHGLGQRREPPSAPA